MPLPFANKSTKQYHEIFGGLLELGNLSHEEREHYAEIMKKLPDIKIEENVLRRTVAPYIGVVMSNPAPCTIHFFGNGLTMRIHALDMLEERQMHFGKIADFGVPVIHLSVDVYRVFAVPYGSKAVVPYSLKISGARGWVAHHNTDIWGDCAPQDTIASSTYWQMGAAWLCLHIFEHYRYTKINKSHILAAVLYGFDTLIGGDILLIIRNIELKSAPVHNLGDILSMHFTQFYLIPPQGNGYSQHGR